MSASGVVWMRRRTSSTKMAGLASSGLEVRRFMLEVRIGKTGFVGRLLRISLQISEKIADMV